MNTEQHLPIMGLLKPDDYAFIRRECRPVLMRAAKPGEVAYFVDERGIDFIADWAIRKLRQQDNGLEVHRLLVVGAGHLDRFTHRHLALMSRKKNATRHAGPDIYVDHYPYGWHITITDLDPDDNTPYLTMELMTVVAFAKERGFTHLRIDNDGPTVPGLPTYNW